MPIFENHRSYRQFVSDVRKNFRYVFSDDTITFLCSFREMASHYEASIQKDNIFCRSQIGHSDRPLEDDDGNEIDMIPCAFPPKRMKPLKDKAREGRANPKGIPYLYLSNDRETAIAECRPWVGQYVSLGYFRITQKLKLVHFTQEKTSGKIYLSTPPVEEIDRIVWEDINRAFSTPVLPDDLTSDYVPTQILAEVAKSKGYDGIAYKSRLGGGVNVALFDTELAELTSCDLFIVGKVHYEFRRADNTYYIQNKSK